jgi:hypothetical protein
MNELREREKNGNHTMRLTLSRGAHSLQSPAMRAPVTHVLLASLTAVALLPGCGRTYDNPFAGTTSTTAPSASAAIVFTSNIQSGRPNGPREVFAVEESGANPTQLTHCGASANCSTLEASFDTDRQRAMVRRVVADTNGDGRLSAADGESLFLVDFARSVEGSLLPGTAQVGSVDWSSISNVIVYSGLGTANLEDIFRMDPNGQNNRNISDTALLRERRPRVDPTGSIAVFERIDASLKGEIWIFFTTQAQSRLTNGGVAGAALPGTPYIVGSDADPDYSPDGRSIVFRRLRAIGDGRGQWDIMAIASDGTGLRTVVSGAAFRDAPDWGTRGIVFAESGADGRSEIVIVDADGANRRSILTVGAGVELGATRWLP